ncbi:MAG: hypothetical protein HUU50_19870 [Candidatus Brocadiae bacterium]|nr:hypothetical protein [Candidatus Brocadiia bacterium]
MDKISLTRNEYVNSCEQLLTIGCILAGFAFSGLIALPGIDVKAFQNIALDMGGNLEASFSWSYYFLFFSTLCFLGTIVIILVYKANGYFIPIKKLKRIHLVSNLIFSIAIATLLMAVVVLGIPTIAGLWGAIFIGLGVSSCFLWENLVPWQKKIRLRQMEEEGSISQDEKG